MKLVHTTPEMVVEDPIDVMATTIEVSAEEEVVALVVVEIAPMVTIEEAMTEVGVEAAVPKDKNLEKIIVALTTTMVVEEHQEVGVAAQAGIKKITTQGLATTLLRVKNRPTSTVSTPLILLAAQLPTPTMMIQCLRDQICFTSATFPMRPMRWRS